MALCVRTHDLDIITEVSDYVAVMYSGRILEYGDAITIFERPRHPFTRASIASYPRIDVKIGIERIPASPSLSSCWVQVSREMQMCSEICREEESESIEI